MLNEKGANFRSLFVKTMVLYLSPPIGVPIAEKDKIARILKLIEDSTNDKK